MTNDGDDWWIANSKWFGIKWLWFNQGHVQASAWKDWGKPQKISARIVGLLAKISTQHLSNTSLECYTNLLTARTNRRICGLQKAVFFFNRKDKKKQVPPKRWHLPTKLHGVASPTRIFFICRAVRAYNLTTTRKSNVWCYLIFLALFNHFLDNSHFTVSGDRTMSKYWTGKDVGWSTSCGLILASAWRDNENYVKPQSDLGFPQQ
jgi:hypothetical protein